MIKLTPAFKDYIWGGTNLKTTYGKQSDLDIVAESWELSTHPDGPSIVANGDYQGQTLIQYIQQNGKAILGTKCTLENDIPILIKFIDAKDNLSIQVHPDDTYALEHEGDYGKTEMWYILEAEPGAQLVYGFGTELTEDEFRASIENNTLTDKLNYVDVQKGDVFFIEPGTMHAIGKGIIITEIQQRSNVTYRAYDYGRVGVDGKPRELHIAKTIDVTTLAKADTAKVDYTLTKYEGYQRGTLASCEYFHVEVLDIEEGIDLTADQTTFHSLVVVEGCANILSSTENLAVVKGETVFIPAGYGLYNISGKCKVLLSTL